MTKTKDVALAVASLVPFCNVENDMVVILHLDKRKNSVAIGPGLELNVVVSTYTQLTIYEWERPAVKLRTCLCFLKEVIILCVTAFI